MSAHFQMAKRAGKEIANRTLDVVVKSLKALLQVALTIPSAIWAILCEFGANLAGYTTRLSSSEESFVSGALVSVHSRSSGAIQMTEYRNKQMLFYSNVQDNSHVTDLNSAEITFVHRRHSCIHIGMKSGKELVYCRDAEIAAGDDLSGHRQKVIEVCSGSDFILARLDDGDKFKTYYFSSAEDWQESTKGLSAHEIAMRISTLDDCGSFVHSSSVTESVDDRPTPVKPNGVLMNRNILKQFRENSATSSASFSIFSSTIFATVLTAFIFLA